MNHFVVLCATIAFWESASLWIDRKKKKAAVRIRGQVRSHSKWVRKEVKKSLGR
jgi:hypothetical protein